MNIVSLVFTILAFICSFIPILGIPFTIFFIVISSVLLIMALRKNNTSKEQKEVSIISSVILVISLIICIVVNILSISKATTIINSIINKELDYNSYYKQKFNNYKSYSKGDNINIDEKLLIKMLDYTNDANEYYINLDIKSVEDNVYYSSYDFILYDEENDRIYYPKYYIDDSNFLSGALNNGENRTSTLKYSIDESGLTTKLYLIYVDDENGVKIAL